MAVTFSGAKDENKSDDRYMKFKEGDNKFRIIGEGIEGYESWFDKKPTRCPLSSKKPDGAKYFTGWHVWDYSDEKLKVLVITQRGINKSLASFQESEDWGSFVEYDIKVTRTTEGTYIDKKDGEEKKSVKYETQAVPPKPLIAKAGHALKSEPVNLNALFVNGDPWSDLDNVEVESFVSEMSQIDTLSAKLRADGVDILPLASFIASLAKQNRQTPDQILESALIDSLYSSFKGAYVKYLTSAISA